MESDFVSADLCRRVAAQRIKKGKKKKTGLGKLLRVSNVPCKTFLTLAEERLLLA